MKYYSVIKGMNILATILATWMNLKTCSAKKQETKIMLLYDSTSITIGIANLF